MTETVEAIQAYLPGLGWVLVPAVDSLASAPRYINDEWLYNNQPRVFDTPNDRGKKFKYIRSEQSKRYILLGPE